MTGVAPPTDASKRSSHSFFLASLDISRNFRASGPLLEVTTSLPAPNAALMWPSPGWRVLDVGGGHLHQGIIFDLREHLRDAPPCGLLPSLPFAAFLFTKLQRVQALLVERIGAGIEGADDADLLPQVCSSTWFLVAIASATPWPTVPKPTSTTSISITEPSDDDEAGAFRPLLHELVRLLDYVPVPDLAEMCAALSLDDEMEYLTSIDSTWPMAWIPSVILFISAARHLRRSRSRGEGLEDVLDAHQVDLCPFHSARILSRTFSDRDLECQVDSDPSGAHLVVAVHHSYDVAIVPRYRFQRPDELPGTSLSRRSTFTLMAIPQLLLEVTAS